MTSLEVLPNRENVMGCSQLRNRNSLPHYPKSYFSAIRSSHIIFLLLYLDLPIRTQTVVDDPSHVSLATFWR